MVTTRRDVERLTDATNELARLANQEIAELLDFIASTGNGPEYAHDVLMDAVPRLVSEYGDIAASVAAEWYEELHPSGQFHALASEGAKRGAVQGSVRSFISGVPGEELANVLSGLSGAVQRHIAYSTRDTVARNIRRDSDKPRWARVPSGAKTCTWCEMLASRGWVYRTDETAGATKHFHDDCDCQIVPEWDQDQAHIDGYDPDAMYERYNAALDELKKEHGQYESFSDREIAQKLRTMYPDQYSDGKGVKRPSKKRAAAAEPIHES